jgi:hypothetical protein
MLAFLRAASSRVKGISEGPAIECATGVVRDTRAATGGPNAAGPSARSDPAARVTAYGFRSRETRILAFSNFLRIEKIKQAPEIAGLSRLMAGS